MEMLKLTWKDSVNSWECEVKVTLPPHQQVKMHLLLSRYSEDSIKPLTKFDQPLINMMLIRMEAFPNKSLNKE